MKRFVVLAVLLLLAFYGAWPAFSVYQIRQGLKTGDAAQLSGKIDFDAVRTSLRPSVEREAEQVFTAIIDKGGPLAAALGPQVREKIMPGLIDRALSTLVTPEVLIRVVRDGRNARETIARIVVEQGATSAGKGLGGLLGGDKNEAVDDQKPATTTSGGDTKARPVYGLSNIKALGIEGPLGFKLGVAKDPAASEPDITAHMAFTGFDWKLVGLTPRNRHER